MSCCGQGGAALGLLAAGVGPRAVALLAPASSFSFQQSWATMLCKLSFLAGFCVSD